MDNELIKNINTLLNQKFGGDCQIIGTEKYTKLQFDKTVDSFQVKEFFNELGVQVLNQSKKDDGLIEMTLMKSINLETLQNYLCESNIIPAPRL